MEESRARTVSVVALLVLFASSLASGCAGRNAKPRTIAALGGLAIAAGSVGWAAGESTDSASGRSLINTGFVAVAAGLVGIVVAGGWMALNVACEVDPDCTEDEQCREIPAPPGGIPYKQCMAR